MNMTTGIIVLLIASILRGWGMLNHRRGPIEAAAIASAPILAILSIFSIVVGLAGALLIGSESSFWAGIIAFIAFWFLSGIWAPVLIFIGL